MKEKKVPIWSKVPSWAWALISLALAVALWLAASGTWPAVFASPEKVLAAFLERAESGLLWEHVWASVSRVLTGFGIAFVVSIPVAFLMAWYDPFRHVVEPWIQFIRNIPPLAYVFLIIAALGIGQTSKITVIFIAAFLVMVITIYQGVKGVDVTLIKAARLMFKEHKSRQAENVVCGAKDYGLTAASLCSRALAGEDIAPGLRSYLASLEKKSAPKAAKPAAAPTQRPAAAETKDLIGDL